jgi:hypothetical protein
LRVKVDEALKFAGLWELMRQSLTEVMENLRFRQSEVMILRVNSSFNISSGRLFLQL